MASRGRRDRCPKSGEIVHVASHELHVGTVAAREARQLFEVQPTLADLGEWHATIEQLFTEPSPRALPQAPRIEEGAAGTASRSCPTVVPGRMLVMLGRSGQAPAAESVLFHVMGWPR